MSSANLLLSLMPDEIRDELLDLSVEHKVGQGNRVPQEWLDGSQILIVTSGIASKYQLSEHGRISEVGMVGKEGLFPTCALLNVPPAPHIVLSQVSELRLRRVRTKDFHRIVGESARARHVVQLFAYAFLTQVASNILSSEQSQVAVRTARWLLMCHDRVDGDVLEVTHDALAQIVFAYRPTVSKIVAAMVEEGLIERARGRIKILSREGLHAMADGSYGLSERYWQQYIGPFGKDQLVKHPREAA